MPWRTLFQVVTTYPTDVLFLNVTSSTISSNGLFYLYWLEAPFFSFFFFVDKSHVSYGA
jgi:hypothetical protein